MNEQPQENVNIEEQEQKPTSGPSVPNKKLLIGIVIVFGVLVTVGAGVYFYTYKSEPKQAACTAEAAICPDGTAVGRTGPNCEFSPCPGEDGTGIDTSDWQTYRYGELGFEFRYPADWKLTEELRRIGEIEEARLNTLFVMVTSPRITMFNTIFKGVMTIYVAVDDKISLNEKISSMFEYYISYLEGSTGSISGVPYIVSTYFKSDKNYTYKINFTNGTVRYQIHFSYGLAKRLTGTFESIKQDFHNDREKFIILQNKILSTFKFIE